MNVLMTLITAMIMLLALITKAHIHVPASLDLLDLEVTAQVCDIVSRRV